MAVLRVMSMHMVSGLHPLVVCALPEVCIKVPGGNRAKISGISRSAKSEAGGKYYVVIEQQLFCLATKFARTELNSTFSSDRRSKLKIASYSSIFTFYPNFMKFTFITFT